MAKIYKIIPVLFFAFFPVISFASSLSISPTSASFAVGDRVTVRILVSSGSPINAISGTVAFPTDLFTVESVSKAGSVLNFWVSEPSFSKGAGTLQFEGVTLGGYAGGTGTVVTARLRAIKEGSGTVSFKSGKVLANDGQGTDVTSSLGNATYLVTPKVQVETPIPAPEIVSLPVEEEIKIEEPQAPASLPAPAIELGAKFGEQAIYGKSKYPKSQVLTTFVALDGVKIFITGETDQNGEFLMLVPRTLKHGIYNVSSVVILPDFSYSHESNKITIKVGNIFSDIVPQIWGLIIALIFSILYLIVRIYFHLKRDKSTAVNKSNIEAIEKDENLIHKSFDALRADVVDRARGVVSQVERENIEELKKDIDSTEKQIFKEIKDIEKS